MTVAKSIITISKSLSFNEDYYEVMKDFCMQICSKCEYAANKGSFFTFADNSTALFDDTKLTILTGKAEVNKIFSKPTLVKQ